MRSKASVPWPEHPRLDHIDHNANPIGQALKHNRRTASLNYISTLNIFKTILSHINHVHADQSSVLHQFRPCQAAYYAIANKSVL